MADVTYTLPIAAEQAIAAERARLMRLRKLDLVNSDYVRREYRAFVAHTIRTARTAVGPDKMIACQCPDCQRVHMMPEGQLWYRCACAPVERPSFRNRVELR